MLLRLLVSSFLLAGTSFAVPTKEKRVHRHGDLSDHPHKDATDFQYDHEAFLGKEDAKTFDQLTPEESKERLAKIIGRIDINKDGFVNHSELHYWIKHRQRRYIEENVNKHWREYDANQDDKISWEEYKNTTYGFYQGEEFDDVEEKDTYKAMLTRDQRRFKEADRDHDGIATREEFTAFLHPEEFDHMRGLVVQETMDDIDKNGDGKVDIDEYIGDMFTPENGEKEPDWVLTERQHFHQIRDENKNGYLEASEVAQWVLPTEVDHADNEAKHLIHETDTNKDGLLSLSEIMDKAEVISLSTITDYGGMTIAEHDEL
ncbi:reticulocalbin-3 isoform X1 [Gadus macrocephalus]|uniref:reticulocalbin-3 isoform X1 n=1 Tax=Gadus macrocephalus TaxID=80720 RepID=UPI0028CBB107|nr:reticulocalbin-3 isoform X1 [Gadus macrocephalus]